MSVYTGTSGYSYKAWKGHFYPEDLKNDAFLEYYSSQLPAVEINNTFYRMPSEQMLVNWAEQTPESFRFVLKVSRRITHFKRLKECESELEYILETAMALGQRLGPFLFQLPPNFKKDTERLGLFLDELPPKLRAAFEFRHDTWFDDETYDLLRGHQGATLCIAETEPDQWEKIPVVSDWGYLRLRRDDYEPADIASWADRIKAQSDWEDVFAFFKHEDAGAGPKMALELADLLD